MPSSQVPKMVNIAGDAVSRNSTASSHDNILLGVDAESTTGTNQHPDSLEEPDELQAVRNAASRDTLHVRLWRFAVAGALLVTAVAITLTTYSFLEAEQTESFETAFEQFSRTIADAAINQQRSIQTTYRGLSRDITATAQQRNEEWPFVFLPYFNTMAESCLAQTGTEVATITRIVSHDQRKAWEQFSADNYLKVVEMAHKVENSTMENFNPAGFVPQILGRTDEGLVPDSVKDFYYPSWEFAPAPYSFGLMNWNVFPTHSELLKAILGLCDQLLFIQVQGYGFVSGIAFTQEEHQRMHDGLKDSNTEHPHSFFFIPIHKSIEDDESPIVAILSAGYAWDAALRQLLPTKVNGIQAVIHNTCDQSFTYTINGPDAQFEGEGDLHDVRYDKYLRVVDLALNTHPDYAKYEGHCRYQLHVYPSERFEKAYKTFTPEQFAIIVFSTFIFVLLVFFVYDMFVDRRNEALVENAAQSNAIVSHLFPTEIRDRLIATSQGQGNTAEKRIHNLKGFLRGDMSEPLQGSRPLADLFLETSILFADIAGFTAWSSVREPSQVFSLLEKLFSSFDQLAKVRRVFKVETVGDCYVAATGIPEQRADHAVLMVRFARDILTRVHTLTKELEITHGPDTGDLGIRVGVHSGPVTAGVLRGERARFQLFGDTMNTAAWMEHTGQVGRVQVSSETAECLRNQSKGHWLIKREQPITSKGKGDLQTYWVGSAAGIERPEGTSQASDSGSCAGMLDVPVKLETVLDSSGLDARSLRLVDWNVEMLLPILRQIVGRRNAMQALKKDRPQMQQKVVKDGPFIPLEEVQEIIHLPDFDSNLAKRQHHFEQITISPVVVEQLRSLITNITSMYRHNSFHNFEHASHVTMSVIKLLSRIVAPSDLDDIDTTRSSNSNEMNMTTAQSAAATLHDHTYGITSDPLTQFACAFSALIHDVDHCGVPNAQLVKEGTRLAQIYQNRSVAEQNSLVLSWELFMSEEYHDLRACICATEVELSRFRELVVNSVLATDIVDKDLKSLRNKRWDKAFQGCDESARDAVNRKATIVIEHLIQASDVAHTMQHWHVYRKWNERFFRECYAAYKSGRADMNPADSWYKGEIGFFDFYIIPLAKKLKDCGVFGKSSDEYLNYAIANRKEWERRGEEMVAEMVATVANEEGN